MPSRAARSYVVPATATLHEPPTTNTKTSSPAVDDVVALPSRRHHEAVDAELELGVRQPLRAGTFGNDDGLADASTAEAGEEIGDRQVQGAAELQQHRQRRVRVAVLDVAEVAGRDARTGRRVAERGATGEALLAEAAADDRLQVEPRHVVTVAVGHQNSAGRDTMKTSTGSLPRGATECVSWAP